MKSLRRRRCINIDICTVDTLKRYAEALGGSHTGVANDILRGKTPPLTPPEVRGCGRQGISMSEALWLAVKAYAASEFPDDPYTSVADRILVGEVPPVPEVYIARGEAMAGAREEERAGTAKTTKNDKEVKGKTSSKKKEKTNDKTSMEEFDKEEREIDRAKLARGTPMDDDNCRPSQEIDLNDEFFGGVKFL